MYNSNIILQIHATYHQLTKAEMKVADYVLQNKKEVLYMSITDLADACEVGDTSVYRFCRTMKLQGYQEFKMKLSLSMSEKAEEKGMLGKVDSLPRKMMKINMSAMKGTYMLMDHQNMIKIVRMIEKVRRVFFGIGYSPLAAEET